jgi:hypothetical protein
MENQVRDSHSDLAAALICTRRGRSVITKDRRLLDGNTGDPR